MSKLTDKIRPLKGRWGVVLLVVIAFVAGALVRGGREPEQNAGTPASSIGVEATKQETQFWTCSMHSQIKLPKPGQCPICGMDLIPVESGEDETKGLRELSVAEHAAKLMEIETAPVERKFVTAEIRMVGKVDYNETRVSDISAWVPGRLDRLFVDYTGVPVRKGDHMVYLHSPELLSAQEELLQAIRAVKNLRGSDVSMIREMSKATVDAAREKLRLWGLTSNQIAQIEKRGKASDHMTIYSPSSGIVIHKHAQEGMYVKTGTKIYTIADLSQVWVRLDAYESDLIWLRYGHHVAFTTESYPGDVFKGTISFIDPILNEATRTVKVRVNVPNPEMKLKPGMFVRAVVRARVASSGRVMDKSLAGKWICPMHPEEVKDGAGKCSICEMPLVRTESLGYVGVDPEKADKPLVIPASAPLITGKRAIVYVVVPDIEKPTFEGREIVLGPRAGDYYLVRRGLKEGEHIVTKGGFKIDAELQIQAKPSMMTPEGGGGGGHAHHAHGGEEKRAEAAPGRATVTLPALVRSQLHKVLMAGNAATASVESGDIHGIHEAFSTLSQKVDSVDSDKLSGYAAMMWKEHAMLLGNDAMEGSEVKKLSEAKRLAELLGEHLVSFQAQMGVSHDHGVQSAEELSPEFRHQLGKVVQGYLAMHKALAADQADQAVQEAKSTLDAVAAVDMALVSGQKHMDWMKRETELKRILSGVGETKEIEDIREDFAVLSELIISTLNQFKASSPTLYRFKCSMAFDDRGATWLQADQQTANPYFGKMMLRCGDVIEVIPGQEKPGGHTHE
ncbi:MAG: efflux RND transporter periplasmic adaptor subunit [Desulfobacterales bacterium]|nr:MAG: efflux RND transporter periplasmic adaptor subunit [Desulfobacterales bacterium]